MADGTDSIKNFGNKAIKILDTESPIQAFLQRQLPGLQRTEDPAAFKQFMESHQVAKATPVEATSSLSDAPTPASLIAEISKVNKGLPITELIGNHPDQFNQQFNKYAEKIVAQMEVGKEYLQNRNTDIKPSVSYLLENKLHNSRTDIQSIYKTLKMEYADSQPERNLLKPVQKFFGYLVDGQTRMQQLKFEVNSIDKNDFSMSDMLNVQLKMAHISQELEFFTSLLNKTLESTKSLMNVQV